MINVMENKVKTTGGMGNIMKTAEVHFLSPNFHNQLDCFPYLLGVRNGVVDLRNGTLRSRLPQDMIYHVCDVEYDPGAPTDLIESVVKSLMADDLEMVDYIQKLLGYAISGEKKEDIFVILTGTGENDGKSILTEMLRLILGSMYVKKTNSKNANVKSNRVVEYKELSKSGKIRFDVVIKATDNDGIPIMNANLKPNLSNAGISITERIVCIPFPVKFIELEPGEKPSLYKRQRNTDVMAMLRADLAGVFNWLVQGSVRWYATQDLRRSMPIKVRNSSASLFV
jgi:putative DNA primase/helicase